jgi:hypothetical protein
MGANRKLNVPHTWLVLSVLLLAVASLRLLYYTALLVEPLDRLIEGALK